MCSMHSINKINNTNYIDIIQDYVQNIYEYSSWIIANYGLWTTAVIYEEQQKS